MSTISGGGTGSRPALDASGSVDPEHVWEHHGKSMWGLACALLGDEQAALRAVALGMVDFYLSGQAQGDPDGRVVPDLARFIYVRSDDICADGPVPRTMTLPPIMVRLGQIAELQRKCVALCCFGRHTYREAADVLELPPGTVATLLTAGLLDLARLTKGNSPPP